VSHAEYFDPVEAVSMAENLKQFSQFVSREGFGSDIICINGPEPPK
jgi:hypothetical protein